MQKLVLTFDIDDENTLYDEDGNAYPPAPVSEALFVVYNCLHFGFFVDAKLDGKLLIDADLNASDEAKQCDVYKKFLRDRGIFD